MVWLILALGCMLDLCLLLSYIGSSAQAEYAAFEEKVRRTVYIDNLSPRVTRSVLRTALDQFGKVKSVRFVPNYMGPSKMPRCALVEMEDRNKVEAVISMFAQFPFMICGMPRPVRAHAAKAGMFDDRPKKPGRRIYCRWLEPNDPDYEVAKKLKGLAKQHAAEASFLRKKQLEQEKKLAKNQAKIVKANYKKYKTIDRLRADRTLGRLVRHYNLGTDDL